MRQYSMTTHDKTYHYGKHSVFYQKSGRNAKDLWKKQADYKV